MTVAEYFFFIAGRVVILLLFFWLDEQIGIATLLGSLGICLPTPLAGGRQIGISIVITLVVRIVMALVELSILKSLWSCQRSRSSPVIRGRGGPTLNSARNSSRSASPAQG